MIATLLAGCGTSGDGTATSLRRAIGSSLVGAQGKTLSDQDRIDRTMAPAAPSASTARPNAIVTPRRAPLAAAN